MAAPSAASGAGAEAEVGEAEAPVVVAELVAAAVAVATGLEAVDLAAMYLRAAAAVQAAWADLPAASQLRDPQR